MYFLVLENRMIQGFFKIYSEKQRKAITDPLHIEILISFPECFKGLVQILKWIGFASIYGTLSLYLV